MLDRYAYAENDAAASAADFTSAIIGIAQPSTASGKRGYLYDLIWGTTGTAADNQLQYLLQRHTALTATEGTPTPLDFSAPASLIKGKHTYTAATLTAGEILLQTGANQRSMQRWVAAPGGEIQIPNVDDDGVTFMAVHASATPTVEATAHFYE